MTSLEPLDCDEVALLTAAPDGRWDQQITLQRRVATGASELTGSPGSKVTRLEFRLIGTQKFGSWSQNVKLPSTRREISWLWFSGIISTNRRNQTNVLLCQLKHSKAVIFRGRILVSCWRGLSDVCLLHPSRDDVAFVVVDDVSGVALSRSHSQPHRWDQTFFSWLFLCF